jgi:hypothetical protein
VVEPRRGQLLTLAAEAGQPGILERLVRVRMIRQELLKREPPLRLSVVMDKSVLLRRIGDQRLMRTQLEHLTRVAELPNVDLRACRSTGRRR